MKLLCFFLMFHRMNPNSTNNEYENQNNTQKNIQSDHFYSSLLKYVAIQKQAIKIAIPNIKVKRFIALDTSCPITKPTKTNFPTSYNALPSSLLWFLSSFIIFILPFYFYKVNKGEI